MPNNQDRNRNHNQRRQNQEPTKQGPVNIPISADPTDFREGMRKVKDDIKSIEADSIRVESFTGGAAKSASDAMSSALQAQEKQRRATSIFSDQASQQKRADPTTFQGLASALGGAGDVLETSDLKGLLSNIGGAQAGIGGVAGGIGGFLGGTIKNTGAIAGGALGGPIGSMIGSQIGDALGDFTERFFARQERQAREVQQGSRQRLQPFVERGLFDEISDEQIEKIIERERKNQENVLEANRRIAKIQEETNESLAGIISTTGRRVADYIGLT